MTPRTAMQAWAIAAASLVFAVLVLIARQWWLDRPKRLRGRHPEGDRPRSVEGAPQQQRTQDTAGAPDPSTQRAAPKLGPGLGMCGTCRAIVNVAPGPAGTVHVCPDGRRSTFYRPM